VENDTKKLVKSLYYLSTVGLAMALSISIGAFLGYWLDKKLNTEPWLFFVCLALGIAAAFRNLYVMVKKFQES
jgi:ATP synthase protein I